MTILPDRTTYAPGDVVTFRVRNEAPTPIGYNFCPAQLEALVGTEWHRYADGRGDAFPCPASLTTLESEHITLLQYRLPATVPPGPIGSASKPLPRSHRTRRNVEL